MPHEPEPNAPDFGDETELEIIIERAQEDAEHFGSWCKPATWLNPPHKIDMNHWSSWQS